MPPLALSFIRRLCRTVGVNRSRDRRAARLPLKFSLADPTPAGGGTRRSFSGFTLDLRSTGLSFVVPMVNMGNCHIFGEGATNLRVTMELPDGPIDMKARPVRYDSAAGAGQGYVVGARILEVSERDRARYQKFLHARS